MRNIVLSNFESQPLSLDDCDAFYFDRQTLYAYHKGKIIKANRLQGVEIIADLTEVFYDKVNEELIPKAIDLTYCSEKDRIYVVLSNGEIFSFPSECELDSVCREGDVNSGIKAAQWSPETELLALVTGDDMVIVMNKEFKVINENYLHSDGFGEKQFITVGWGKKETQFRGSEGKFNAKEKANEALNITTGGTETIKISWRGDAEYFVINSINSETSRRYLRVFSKRGILQYTSEDLSGVEHSLDWSSSGNLIASSQVLPNKHIICFFEKNGLKHGEFSLPYNHEEIKVEEVLWSKDSKILALLITKLSSGNKYVQLYTVNNYHWYCKYTINFDKSVPVKIQWDNQKYNTLHVITKNQNGVHHYKYSYLWTVNKSRGNISNDESLVAVIDGCNVKVTSFKRGIIPPPMCTYEIQCPVPVNSVSFAPDVLSESISSNDLLVELSNNTLMIYKFVSEGSNKISYKFVAELNNFCKEFETCLNSFWVDEKTFILCLIKINEKLDTPILTVLTAENVTDSITFERDDILLQSPVALLKASKSVVLIHDNNGDTYLFSKGNKTLEKLSSSNKNLINLEIKTEENGKYSYFSLDNLNKFYMNNNFVMSKVLSFHLHENFILLTTMEHKLLCLSDSEITSNDLSNVYSRKVERGSRIITSVHKDMKVILQMPRGNLECIQPRPLSVYVLGEYLDSLNYFSAFDLMRKQRINLNLLYDHDPFLFSRNINKFLEQIKDVQWIGLFLADLSDEDVTKSMYSAIYKTKDNGINTQNKIDTVCELIEKAITQNFQNDNYLLPLLTSYVKRGKTEYLEKVLSKLKELRERELAGEKPSVSFNEAFKYILYLIDVEQLYKVALGMYDLDLTLLIASKSQKDPKEYFQFLNELKQLESNYQKFTIDKYLKRYTKALASLVLCEGDDTFNECINFIKTHKLYKYALKLIPENTDRYKNVCICFGDELMKMQLYEEAGIMYMNAGRYENAITAYRKSGNWQEAVFCGIELKLNENELKDLYLDLALELYEVKNYKEAATVYLDYLGDIEECLRTLSKGKYFAEAYRIAYLHQSAHLIMQIVIPEILEQANLMHLHIANFSETFNRQKNRLQVVRKKKAETPQDKNEFDDLYSDTSTIFTHSNATSRNTNRTYRSAKNRRKQERKLLSLKEGSPYEDLALVTSLHNIVSNCYSLKPEIRELNKFLIKIREYDAAEKLQKKFEEFLQLIETSKAEIWIPDLLNRKQYYGPEATSNEISEMFMKSENVTPVLINPKYAIPPETQNNVKWELELLNL